MKKVNLCCGNNILSPIEWDNYDYNPYNKYVKFIDLNKLDTLINYFKYNSVPVFRIDNGIEHLKVTDLELCNELTKYLKEGGYLDIIVPSESNQILHLKNSYTKNYFSPLINKNYGTTDNTKRIIYRKLTFRCYKYRSLKEMIYNIIEKIRKIFVAEYEYRIYK